ncbi:MAG: LicD family protein [Lachnospiraceae bacterium]|nr:LicD family protein [Lachnospiraceae bacterium]
MIDGLEELQHRLVEMLLELQKFTDAHDLSFFLVGGSALGAYRHQGFIPWDDDVDIAMMRSDFEKLEKYMEEAGNRIGDFLYSPVEKQIVPEAPVSHLYDTKHIENGYENTAKIDIHPIDGIPENKMLRKVQKVASLIYYLSDYRLPVKNKGKKIRAISKVILKVTPDFLFDFYMRVTKKIFTAWDDKTSTHICSLFGVAGYEQEVMPRSYLMPLKKSKFADAEFLVPRDTHNYLKRLYGDYEKLPPKEDRYPRHDIYKMYAKSKL